MCSCRAALRSAATRCGEDIASMLGEVNRGFPEKLALLEAGRQLKHHINRRAREMDALKKQGYIQKYIPHIGDALQEILGISEAEREEIIETLTNTLERSRKL